MDSIPTNFHSSEWKCLKSLCGGGGSGGWGVLVGVESKYFVTLSEAKPNNNIELSGYFVTNYI